MQQESKVEVLKNLSPVIWRIALYLFCYRVCFGIVLGVVAIFLSRIVPSLSKTIMLLLWVACYYIYSTREVVKIVSKKVSVDSKNIILSNLSAVIALSVLQVILSMASYLTGGSLKFVTVVGIVLSNAIVFGALVFWFKKLTKV